MWSTWCFVWPGKTRAGDTYASLHQRHKLDVRVSATSVRIILRRRHLGPAPRRGGPNVDTAPAHAPAGTLACDFLTVETIGLTRLYMLFMIELSHR